MRVEIEALAKTEETKKKKDRRNGKKGEEGLVDVERSVEVEADAEARWVEVVKTEEKLEAGETKTKAEGKRRSLDWQSASMRSQKSHSASSTHA